MVVIVKIFPHEVDTSPRGISQEAVYEALEERHECNNKNKN